MYKSEPEGRFLYVLNDALTEFKLGGPGAAEVPVPPCIVAARAVRPSVAEEEDAQPERCVQVTLLIEDRASSAMVLKITADGVRIQVGNGYVLCMLWFVVGGSPRRCMVYFVGNSVLMLVSHVYTCNLTHVLPVHTPTHPHTLKYPLHKT